MTHKKNIKINSKLKSIIKKGENQKLEFKESVNSSLDKEIVAFANSKGGEIYIGITDTGEIKGVHITNQLKNRIENIARNCDPKVSICIKELEIDKKKILIITIKESKDKPHRCSTGFYDRRGSLSQKMTTDEVLEMGVREGKVHFDKKVCKDFNYKKHFDRKKLFSFLDRAEITYSKRNVLQPLKTLKVAKINKGEVTFNNAGVLFFSKYLEDIYSHTKISCAIFRGIKRIKVLDRKIFNKDILHNVEEALSYLRQHLRLEYKLTGALRREEVLEIPEKALREALVNAVTHRDYFNSGHISVEIHDDRVEITNPGGLPKGLDKKEFGRVSVPRNFLIVNLMQRARYIEEMGTGIKRMKELVKQAGLKSIRFKFGGFFTIIFPRNLLYPDNGTYGTVKDENGRVNGRVKDENGRVNGRVKDENGRVNVGKELGVKGKKLDNFLQVLYFIENNDFSLNKFSKTQKISLRTVGRYLKLLKEKGLISFEGASKTGKYRVTEKYKKLKKK